MTQQRMSSSLFWDSDQSQSMSSEAMKSSVSKRITFWPVALPHTCLQLYVDIIYDISIMIIVSESEWLLTTTLCKSH